MEMKLPTPMLMSSGSLNHCSSMAIGTSATVTAANRIVEELSLEFLR